jgi:hypothetical protein
MLAQALEGSQDLIGRHQGTDEPVRAHLLA